MISFYKKYWRTAFDIALIILTVLLIMWVFSFLYNIAKPIFYSFVIFLCIEPLAKRLHKWGMKKAIASAISAILFSLIVVGIISGLIVMVTVNGANFIDNFPKYQQMLTIEITNLSATIQERLDKLPFEINLGTELASIAHNTSGTLQIWLKNAFTFLAGYLTSFTSFVINAGIGLILAYFLSIEIVDWKKFASEKTPNTFKNAFFFLRDNVFRGIATYLKAQAKLIGITFVVILIALLLLRVENALIISLVMAIFDVLPLLGVSTLFIPWITYLFIVGDINLAIWLTALWLLVILTRQFLEPKITGESIGVSAFTMFAFMIIALSVFGIAGMILSPILVILIKALVDQGYVERWIRKPVGEYDDNPSSVVQADNTSKANNSSKNNVLTNMQSFLENLKDKKDSNSDK